MDAHKGAGQWPRDTDFDNGRSIDSPILRHTDGHPTFLVLLDPHTTPWLLDLLDALLINDELAVAQPLGPHEVSPTGRPVAPVANHFAGAGVNDNRNARVRAVAAV